LKVAILGTGPSAAYSAMACEQYPEVTSEVISNQAPPIFFPGAFWPRFNPTAHSLPETRVYVSSVGTAIEYLKKQWGMVDPDWLKETSFPKQSRFETAYNPYDLFGKFWKTKDIHLVPALSDNDVKDLAKQYDLIFMTFPTAKSKKALKPFTVQCPIISYPTDAITNHYCIYDGESEDSIIRISYLFGYIHTEYSTEYIPKVELIASGKVSWVSDTIPSAPQWDPEDVPADNVTLIGRFACWSRKVLSSDAYDITTDVLKATM
jgi:hypothetical protein